MHAERMQYSEDHLRQLLLHYMQELHAITLQHLSASASYDQKASAAAMIPRLLSAREKLIKEQPIISAYFDLLMIERLSAGLNSVESNVLIVQLNAPMTEIRAFYSPVQRLLRDVSNDHRQELRDLYLSAVNDHLPICRLSRLLLSDVVDYNELSALPSMDEIQHAIGDPYISRLIEVMRDLGESYYFYHSTYAYLLRRVHGHGISANSLLALPDVPLEVIPAIRKRLCPEAEYRLQRAVRDGMCVQINYHDLPILRVKFDGLVVASAMRSFRLPNNESVARGTFLFPEERLAERIAYEYDEGTVELELSALPNGEWIIARNHSPLNYDPALLIHTLSGVKSSTPASSQHISPASVRSEQRRSAMMRKYAE